MNNIHLFFSSSLPSVLVFYSLWYPLFCLYFIISYCPSCVSNQIKGLVDDDTMLKIIKDAIAKETNVCKPTSWFHSLFLLFLPPFVLFSFPLLFVSLVFLTLSLFLLYT